MPVVFEPAEVLDLNRWGIFTTWRYPGFEIGAGNATTVSAADTGTFTHEFQGQDPHAQDSLPLRPHMGIKEWGAIVERFNWGATSRPDLVYYEIWNWGRLVPMHLQEGYHCGSKIGWSNIDNRCVPPGTLVMANDSLRPIENLHVGDRVLTKQGRYRPIVQLYQDPFDGELTTIKAYHMPAMTLTPNHKVWASQGNGFHWVQAKDIRPGDHVVLAFPQEERDRPSVRVTDHVRTGIVEEDGIVYGTHPLYRKNPKAHGVSNEVPLSPDFMRLAGFYLAEGWTRGPYLCFGFSTKEKEHIGDIILTLKQLFNLPATIHPRKNSGGLEIQVGCLPLASLFKELFGTGAHKKHLPHFFLELPREKLTELLKGYARGDGSGTSKGGRRMELDSVSPNLANQMRLILLKLGVISSLRLADNSRGLSNGQHSLWRVYADGYHQLTADIFRRPLLTKKVNMPKKARIEGNHLVTRVASVGKERYRGPVFNIEVEEDHSYNLLGGTVSNSTHPAAAESLQLRIWNCSGARPRNVYVEFAMWFYWFPMRNLQKLFEISDINQFGQLNQKHLALVRELIRLRHLVEGKSRSDREVEEEVRQSIGGGR